MVCQMENYPESLLSELNSKLDISGLKYLEQRLHYKYIEPDGEVSWDPSCFSTEELEIGELYFKKCCEWLDEVGDGWAAWFIQEVFVLFHVKENE